jgi:hypothetical protein
MLEKHQHSVCVERDGKRGEPSSLCFHFLRSQHAGQGGNAHCRLPVMPRSRSTLSLSSTCLFARSVFSMVPVSCRAAVSTRVPLLAQAANLQ